MATTVKASKGAQLQAVPEAEGDGAPPKKSRKKLFVIILAVLILLGAGGGAALYFLSGAPAPAAAQKQPAAPTKPPTYINLEQFTVNLQSEGIEQFLQIAITIEVTDEEAVEVFKSYAPLVRSRLLLLLSSRKGSEISSEEGKRKLSNDILAEVKKPFAAGLPPQKVTGIHFTSFVIQ